MIAYNVQALNNTNVCALIYVLYRSYCREMIDSLNHKYTHNGSKNQSFLYNTNGITHKSTHIHFYYSRPDIAGITITTTTQLVILNLNGISYIQ